MILGIDMLSTVKPPKTKNELITALNKRNPLKFEVLEYSDAVSKTKISTALEKASRKGSFTVILVED